MELKHTKGKWKITERDEYYAICVDSEYSFIGVKIDKKYKNDEANAKLVESAPEMLEREIKKLKLLKTILFYKDFTKYINDMLNEEIELTIEVIEKATGLSIEEVLK